MRLFTFLIFTFVFNTCFSQLVFEDVMSTNTSNSGYLCNDVRAISFDSPGNIWINFSEGLAKYNGQYWEYFTRNNSPIDFTHVSMTIDSDDNVWLTNGWDKIYKYNGNTWFSYSNINFIPGINYGSCADTSGNIYFTTSGFGVVKFSDTSYVFLDNATIGLLNNQTTCLFIDNQDQLWIGHQGGVSIYNGSICNYQYMSNIGGNVVIDINQDLNGNMWFATDAGIAKYDGINWTNYDPLQMFGVYDAKVTCLESDNNGGIWCGTSQQGIYYFDGSNWILYNDGNELNTNWINSINCDTNNKIWVCTRDMGINIFENQQWSEINTLDGMSNNSVMTMACADNGNIWFGTWHCAIKFDGTTWTNLKYERGGQIDQFSNSLHYSIASIDNGLGNKLWFGGYIGESNLAAACLNDTIWTGFLSVPQWTALLRPVYQALEDTSDIVWFATDKALNRMKIIPNADPQWTTYKTQDGLLDNKVRAILRDNTGNLVIGTWGGINLFDGNIISILPMPAQEQLSHEVSSLLEDQFNNLWAGTSDGLGCFDGQNWTVYKTSNGLADNYVNALYQSSDNSIWVATKNGISRFDGSGFISYNKSDGLIADDITDIVEDLQGNMYFSSLYGVSKVDAGYLSFETESKRNLSLYPNPAKNIITISSPTEILTIELYSPTGQLLRKIKNHKKQETVDVSSLAPGNYFIRAIGKEDVLVKKFVVVR